MRDKNNRMYCVSCKLYIDNEPEIDNNPSSNPGNTETDNPTNEIMMTENNSQNKMAIEDSIYNNNSLVTTIESTIFELESKLKYANELLQKKNDINELNEICALINQCGLALSTMIKLRKSL